MTKRELILLTTTILFASTTAGLVLQGKLHHGPRPGFEHGPDGKKGPRPDFFAMMDTNKDGFVTRDEMTAHQTKRLEEMFATVDTDKDGRLTKDEMDKGRELMRAKWKAKMEAERKAAETAPADPAPVPAQ